MGALLGIALAIVSILVVALPFLSKRRTAREDDPISRFLEDLERKRRQIYLEIRSLQTDHDTGKIPEEEFRTLLQEYRLRAAELLKRQREIEEKRKAIEESIELEVSRIRTNIKNGHMPVCPNCSREVEEGSRFCPECGADLQSGA